MAEAALLSEELRQALLVQGPGEYQKHYKVAHLACGRGEPRSFVNLLLIAEHQGKVLVAVPEAAWGRSAEERILPTRALTRAVLVEVAVALGWAGLLYLHSRDAVVVTSLASDLTQVTTLLTSC